MGGSKRSRRKSQYVLFLLGGLEAKMLENSALAKKLKISVPFITCGRARSENVEKLSDFYYFCEGSKPSREGSKRKVLKTNPHFLLLFKGFEGSAGRFEAKMLKELSTFGRARSEHVEKRTTCITF